MARLPACLCAFVLFLSNSLLSGCGGAEPGGGTRADRAAAEGVFLRGNGNDPDTLDPHLATTVSAGNILFNLFEGLTRLNPETLAAEPAMAERWEVSPDGRTHTFHLREALWSNGDPVTAGDFVFSWRRMVTPALAANYAYMLFPLQHAEAISLGERPPEDLGVEAVDARTLRLTLERPVPWLPSALAHWTWFPLHPQSIRDAGATTDRTVLWTRPGRMVTNGPFVLAQWQPGKIVRVEANPRYWEADRVSLAAAEFHPFADAGAEERAFRGGDLHLTYSFPIGRLSHYREHAPDVLRIDPYFQSNGWIVNTLNPPLDDPRVRRALSLSIDRAAITERVLGGVRQPAFSHVPPGRKLLREDVEEARALLEAAGYPGGDGLRELEMILPSGRDWVRVAEVLQQHWARIGIPVRIQSLERTTYFSQRTARDFDLCFLGWVGDFPEPETFLDLWRGGAGNNFSGWRDPEYDALLDAATEPGVDRSALLAEAEARLMDALPVIPVAFGSTQFLLDRRVQGWHPNLLNHHPLRAVRFDEDPASANRTPRL